MSFCSNDYLGLASHPALATASARAFEKSGFGAAGSRLVCGTLPEHLELESQLAALVGAPAALLFPTGYQANLGVLTALAGPQDLIVADRAVHASIIDGSRLSRAKLAFYRHLDLSHARRHLERLGPKARRRFLVTESLFSMDGDIAPVAQLAALATSHDATLVVDEAHAIGCFGPQGGGLCAKYAVKPDILVGTLGKALGASGAFVAGSSTLRSYLVNRARTFLFTTSLPPPIAAAARASLAILASPDGDRLRSRLHEASAHFRAAAALTPDVDGSPILPFILGSDQAALLAADRLRDRGFLVQAIRPPTVSENTARLRVTLSAAHTLGHIDEFASALATLTTPLSRHRTARPPTPQAQPLPPARPARPPRHNHRGLFILGTDTAVGKTTVGTALLHTLVARGHSPVPFKPVETGAEPIANDAIRLLDASANASLPIEVVCPWPFPQAVAPAAAAAATGTTLTLPKILSAAAAASAFGAPLIIESAGGVLTPYASNLTSADLAEALGFPVLLVARNTLGTVNHTALAVAEIRRRSLQLLGILLVNTQSQPTPDQATNPSMIAGLTGLTPMGTLPYIPSPTPQLLAQSLDATVDLLPILRLLT